MEDMALRKLMASCRVSLMSVGPAGSSIMAAATSRRGDEWVKGRGGAVHHEGFVELIEVERWHEGLV